MLVSLRHRLVILAMPKCASTSIETALAPRMDMVITNTPAAKHTPFRKYDRFLRRYLETYTDGPLEVVSLFRDPEDWLRSWWRYRSRDELADPTRSARGWSFERYVEAYLSGRAGPASVGSQARFVSTKEGSIGCDRIFRYETIETFVRWLSDRVETEVTLDRLNPSPPAGDDATLVPASRQALEVALEREFRIHREIAE